MRYQPILMLRLEEEERALAEQNELKKRAGIVSESDEITVTEKTITDYVKQIGYVIASGIFIILVFIGMLMVLNPSSREILLGTFGL